MTEHTVMAVWHTLVTVYSCVSQQ